MGRRRFRWRGKRVVVTGAASGIGRALAHGLGIQGATLALSDIQDEELAVTATQARAAGATVHTYRLDVADRGALEAHVSAVLSDMGGVDAVINNAGVALAAEATDQRFEDIDWLLGINLHGVIDSTQLFLPHLIASGDGCLVNISSVFGLIGVPGQSIYNAAKFGVRGYTEAIAMEMEMAGHPVSVHCVHPGGVATNIVRASRVVGQDRDAFSARFASTARTTPADASAQILEGVERGRRRILVGVDAHVIHLLSHLLGPSYHHVVRRAYRWFVGGT